MKKPDWNTVVAYGYIIFLLLMVIIGIAVFIGDICFIFTTLASDEMPFWMKWMLITGKR